MDASAETEMVKRCRRGETRAWDDLFDLHYSATARFLGQWGGSWTPEDIEEICQETFLAVVRNLRAFHGQSRLQTWIFRIAMNKARDYLEKQQAAKRGGGSVLWSLDALDFETGLSLDLPSPTPAPDAVAMTAENVDRVGTALTRLSTAAREIILLRYFADLSYEEIAQTLGLKPKTVSSRLSKSLDRLEVVLRQMAQEEEVRGVLRTAATAATGS